MTRSAFKVAKAAGMSAREVWQATADGIAKAAKEQGWRLSERAATLADQALELRQVYGKRATRFLFENVGR